MKTQKSDTAVSIYINKLLFTIRVLSLLVLFCNCEAEEKEDSSGATPEIYYRWTEDLGFPPGTGDGGACNVSVASYYNNSHPDLPAQISKDIFYKVSPGSFTINLVAIGGGTATKTLVAPERGKRRYYTHMIKKYHPPYNNCIITVAQDDAFKYEDRSGN